MPPDAVYTVIGVLAAVENVFPPVPADTAVAVGAFLSKGGRVGVGNVFLITWVANVAGAVGVYVGARRIGRPFFRGRLGRRLLKPRALARLESLYERYGVAGIFVSRFIPGVRAVVPPFAGVAALGAVKTIVPLVTASAIWYGTITLIAATVVREFNQIAEFMRNVNRTAMIAGAVLGLGVGIWWWVRRRQRPNEADPS